MTLRVAAERGAVDRPAESRTATFVRNSITGSVWTIVSRATGLAQSIAVATVLGATYLGNTYQAINALPNIVYYQLLAGSLFASILVPPLVSKRSAGDTEGSKALAQGFYGTLLLAGTAFCLVLILAGPLILRGLTRGVSDTATAAAQRRVGLLFLVLFVVNIRKQIVTAELPDGETKRYEFTAEWIARALAKDAAVFLVVFGGRVFESIRNNHHHIVDLGDLAVDSFENDAQLL